MSRDVCGLRPNKSWEGVIVEGRDGSGMVRLTQHARATFSSQQVCHALHSSDNTSTMHAPACSTNTLAPWVIGRAELDLHH